MTAGTHMRSLLALATAALVPVLGAAQDAGAERDSGDEVTGPPSRKDRGAVPGDVFEEGTIPESLVAAIVMVESSGNPRVVGQSGERGLMQIKRETWDAVTRNALGAVVPFDCAFDPETNVRVGVAYLEELRAFLAPFRSQWQSDELTLLLACYNAGPTSVRAAEFDVDRLSEQQRGYVERVKALDGVYSGPSRPAGPGDLAWTHMARGRRLM